MDNSAEQPDKPSNSDKPIVLFVMNDKESFHSWELSTFWYYKRAGYQVVPASLYEDQATEKCPHWSAVVQQLSAAGKPVAAAMILDPSATQDSPDVVVATRFALPHLQKQIGILHKDREALANEGAAALIGNIDIEDGAHDPIADSQRQTQIEGGLQRALAAKIDADSAKLRGEKASLQDSLIDNRDRGETQKLIAALRSGENSKAAHITIGLVNGFSGQRFLTFGADAIDHRLCDMDAHLAAIASHHTRQK